MFPVRASSWWKTAPLLGLLVAGAGASDAARPFYPEQYRQWTVAKFKFIGPESAQWESQGGLRHHFANEAALASWGRFSDGSVIVDERVHARLDDKGVWQEDGLAHVAHKTQGARDYVFSDPRR